MGACHLFSDYSVIVKSERYSPIVGTLPAQGNFSMKLSLYFCSLSGDSLLFDFLVRLYTSMEKFLSVHSAISILGCFLLAFSFIYPALIAN